MEGQYKEDLRLDVVLTEGARLEARCDTLVRKARRCLDPGPPVPSSSGVQGAALPEQRLRDPAEVEHLPGARDGQGGLGVVPGAQVRVDYDGVDAQLPQVAPEEETSGPGPGNQNVALGF